MNILIKEVEEECFRYGFQSNSHKFELINTQKQANIHLKENARVPKVRLATDPGCTTAT